MGKRRRNMDSSEPDGNWKPLPINLDSMGDDASFGVVCFEEMEDYDDDFLVMKKKKKSTKTVEEQLEDAGIDMDEDLGRKKKKKKPEKKKSKKLESFTMADLEEEEDLEVEDAEDYTEEIVEDAQDGTVEGMQVEDSVEQVDMSAWDGLYLPDGVRTALMQKRFTAPMPIQSLTLPSAIRDRMDIVGAAETGSGKTLAFGIPIIAGILRNRSQGVEPVDGTAPPQALILTPTRELAMQVKDHITALAKPCRIRVEAIVGGMSLARQQRVLRKSPEIIVATPGRLWELVDGDNPCLSQIQQIKYLVVDETDRMTEKGHFEEFLQLLELLNSEDVFRNKRQTMVFSATMSIIHQLPKRFKLKKHSKIREVTAEDKIKTMTDLIGVKAHHKVVDLTQKEGVAEAVTEARLDCHSFEDKDQYLYYLLRKYPGRTLVFCNNIDCVRRVSSVLNLLQMTPLQIHGSMQQRQRLKNLNRFQHNPYSVLVATDVAARGLDIPNIQHVIHYQVPITAENYIHRSGRTARAHTEGISIMFIDPTEAQHYKKHCITLNRDQDLNTFPVDAQVLKSIKKAVNLARKIESIQNQKRRDVHDRTWFKKNADEMELPWSDDSDSDDTEGYAAAQARRQADSMKQELKQLVSQAMASKHDFSRYPTKTGKLVVPKSSSTDQTALLAMQSQKTSNKMWNLQPTLHKKKKLFQRGRKPKGKGNKKK